MRLDGGGCSAGTLREPAEAESKVGIRSALRNTCTVAAVLLCIPAAVAFEGKVVRVLDGDTIEVLHDRQPERVRLNGIDCPEKAQAFGSKAKQYTSGLCFGKVVSVEEHGHDRYGRTIGEIKTSDGKDVNHELVGAGLAWWYRKYAPKDTVLQELEEGARREKRGLWADPDPVAPWDFRHRTR